MFACGTPTMEVAQVVASRPVPTVVCLEQALAEELAAPQALPMLQ